MRDAFVSHDHAEYVPGCFRCELSRDEMEVIREMEDQEIVGKK